MLLSFKKLYTGKKSCIILFRWIFVQQSGEEKVHL